MSVFLSSICVCAHASQHMWKSEDNFGELGLSFSYTGLWLNRNQQALLPSKPSYRTLDRLLTSVDIPTLRRLEQKKIEFEVNMSYTKTWRNTKILSPEWMNEWMNVFSPWMNKLPLVNLMNNQCWSSLAWLSFPSELSSLYIPAVLRDCIKFALATLPLKSFSNLINKSTHHIFSFLSL